VCPGGKGAISRSHHALLLAGVTPPAAVGGAGAGVHQVVWYMCVSALLLDTGANGQLVTNRLGGSGMTGWVDVVCCCKTSSCVC
jgi:hypothetical protein